MVSVVRVVGARSGEESYREATTTLKKLTPTPQAQALLSIRGGPLPSPVALLVRLSVEVNHEAKDLEHDAW